MGVEAWAGTQPITANERLGERNTRESLHLTEYHFQGGQQQRVSTQDRPSSQAINQDSVELESLDFMENLPEFNAVEA